MSKRLPERQVKALNMRVRDAKEQRVERKIVQKFLEKIEDRIDVREAKKVLESDEEPIPIEEVKEDLLEEKGND